MMMHIVSRFLDRADILVAGQTFQDFVVWTMSAVAIILMICFMRRR